MDLKNLEIRTKKNNLVRASVYGYANLSDSPCLIISHGFKGFKDWGFFPYAANYFAERGYFVLTFNFSHNGVGESLTEFDELDKFANNSYSLELSELQEIAEKYLEGEFGKTTNKKIALLGHSRGGAVSALAANRILEVETLVLWASISDVDRYTERQKKEWRDKGYIEALNSRTKQMMRMNYSFLKDIEENKDGLLNVKKAVSNFNKPIFIAHGKEDLSVRYKEAEELYEASNKSLTELFTLYNTGHTFDVVHPFKGAGKKFEELLEKTYQFLKKNFQ